MSKNGFIAINRFGMGSSIEDTIRISKDPKNWLLSQLSKSKLTKETRALSQGLSDLETITKKVQVTKDTPQKERDKIKKLARQIFRSEIEKRTKHAISTDNPFLERLALFWSNHFTVSVKGNPLLIGIAGVYEREAIRPHVLGKFSDMLLAVTRHPAMIVYLDNQGSFGPNSKAGNRRGRGLNENLAREILELHTLGVNGGYTQEDIISLAKIITGWTIKPPQMAGKAGYRYIDRMHEPGTHTLLGRSYAQHGEKQGIEALTDLAFHPSTARFISTKLAMHFISDTPPQSAIAKLEKTFLNTGGDLLEVSKTLIELPEVWNKPLGKFKTPYELIVSSLRTLNAGKHDFDMKKVISSFQLMDHMPFGATSPAGWSDLEADWLSSNSLMNRIEWAHALSQLVPFKANPNDVAKIVIGPAADADTMLWISRAPSAKDGLALIMASPAFQRR